MTLGCLTACTDSTIRELDGACRVQEFPPTKSVQNNDIVGFVAQLLS